MNGIHLACPAARKILPSFMLILSSFLFTACGGGSGGSNQTNDPANPPSADNGEVIIGLTDAEGDFHSYTVDVLSLKLVHQNGSEVETLPLSTRVDFAQYTELTEFLSAATVPNGVYTSASLLVDYSNAEIIVEDSAGVGVAGIALDSTGATLGQLELSVEFENTETLRIAPGIPAHITLDFDLAASNSVDLSLAPAEVTVDPILIADTLLENPKPRRLRGLLNTVNVDEDAFAIYIRPFYRHSGEFGSVRVYSDDETLYEIDQQDYLGHDGVRALDMLEARTPIVVLGLLDRNTRQFTANEVLAGTSVPWGDHDIVQGNILSRNGNELTLSRVVRRRADNEVRHHQQLTVIISDQTAVKKQGDLDPVDISALSVGQRIRVIGEMSDDNSIDATEGRVRMLYTHLNGNTVTDLPLAIDLNAIDRRRVSVFDFTGTGSSDDADPNNYEIDTSSLCLDAVDIGEPLKVTGHVRPFGLAPEDFEARTVVAVSQAPAKILVNWADGGTPSPFLVHSDNELVLDLSTSGHLHKVIRAGVTTDILNLALSPSIVPNSSGNGIFIIAHAGDSRLYMNFATFSDALASLLDGTIALSGLSAKGQFSDADAVFTARKIIVRLN